MSLTSREIREILAIIEDSGWDEAEISVGDVTLSVAKGAAGASVLARDGDRDRGADQAPAGAPAAPPAAEGDASSPGGGAAVAAAPQDAGARGADPVAGGHVVSSPSVGLFWRAPEPGAPPFVEQGQKVVAGQELCIVEIMKLMQQITADVAGAVTAIHVENGQHVEFGTPLFSIAPDPA
jgi:acetyl-CoA carboxylase biotin carboxyl carrier protein